MSDLHRNSPRAYVQPVLTPAVASSRAVERNLVVAAHLGDLSAQRRLTALLHPVLLRVARRLLAKRAVAMDAVDLAQDVWLASLKNGWRILLAYDPARSSLRHFIACASRRVMLSLLRQRGRTGSCEQPLANLPELPAESGERQHLARDELAKVVRALRSRLPSKSWYCFQHVVLGEASVPELMRELSATRTSIDVRLSRARTEARATRAALT